jgi:hypothetical protein
MVSTRSITWCQHQQPQSASRPLGYWSHFFHSNRWDGTQPLASHLFFSGIFWNAA